MYGASHDSTRSLFKYIYSNVFTVFQRHTYSHTHVRNHTRKRHIHRSNLWICCAPVDLKHTHMKCVEFSFRSERNWRRIESNMNLSIGQFEAFIVIFTISIVFHVDFWKKRVRASEAAADMSESNGKISKKPCHTFDLRQWNRMCRRYGRSNEEYANAE